MIRLLVYALAAALSLVPDASAAPPRSSHSQAVHARSEKRCESCARTQSGRIRRSTTVRRQFQRENPCPATGLPIGACPDYQVDHLVPLACGGVDEVGNMQWQTIAEARAKDRVERSGCHY
jgi:5-methylcytosine-specific restriction endonuclease McrA